MKRYRVFSQDFDFTANSLDFEINDEWDEKVKEGHRQHHERLIERLTHQYGEWGLEEKIDNLRSFGAKPCSIVSYHNLFYNQAREAFVVGTYYPALTAACALGERILNHLILELRNEYRGEPGFSQIANKDSFDNWDKMTGTLESWGVLLPGVGDEFRALANLRPPAIHYHPNAEPNRDMAIAALKHLGAIINVQFGTFGPRPWFITDIGGVAPFIRKEWESDPFIKHFYLPKYGKVGPHHDASPDLAKRQWVVQDEEYEDRDITDEEFVQLYDASVKRRLEALAES
jgi:hypothetical protein